VGEGYARASTTRIAEVAGVSIGTLYQYYPSREALVAALIDRHIEKVLTVLADSVQSWRDESLAGAARQMIRVLLHMHAVEPKLHAVLTQHFPEADGTSRLRELNTHSQQLLEAFLRPRRAQLRPKNLRLASFMLVHAVQAVISAAVLDDSIALDDEALAEELTQLALGYLRRRG
jgi:AcrR family transcriptional regulator